MADCHDATRGINVAAILGICCYYAVQYLIGIAFFVAREREREREERERVCVWVGVVAALLVWSVKD